jgi:DNA-binding PadR family transcriptional regulator
MTSGELRRPTYFILAALIDRPLHGYAIMKTARALSDGDVRLSTGTLFGALDRLEEEGLVRAGALTKVDGRARREYTLTDAGRDALAREAARMRSAASVVEARIAVVDLQPEA